MVPFKTTNLSVSAAATIGTTLSAQGIVYAQGGNSNQWNSSYNTSTNYQSTSSNFVYQRINSFTPTVGDWYRIITGSGMMGGTIKIGGIYNNCITDVEFQFNMAGYGTGGSIQQTRFSSYNNGNVSQVRIGGDPSAGNVVYLDINVGGSSGAYAPLYIQYTPSAGTYTGTMVTSPVSGATVFSTSAGYYYLLTLGHGFRTTNSVIGNSIQDLAGNTLDLKANINSPTFTGTVGGITKTMVGLGNVDNTSDANKPVSTATNTLLQSTSALLTPLTVTRTLTGQLLLTSVYQGASGNWQSTYTTVQANSASWEESADITAVTTVVASNSGNWNNAYNTGTVYQSNSATYATNSTVNSVSSLLTPLTLTRTLTGQLVTNTDFSTYRTSVAAATATLLLTTTYQNASGSFATNTLLQSTSALLTPLSLTNTLTSQLVLNTNFDSYKTSVAASTATLLPTTIYQGASGNWQNTSSVVQANSASWAVDSTTDTGVRALTSNWQGTYTTVQNNSATNWNYQGTDLKALSSNWQSTYTTVQSNSASWATDSTTDTGVRALTGNWQGTYTTVQNNSATAWNYQGTDLKALSSNWQSAYTTVQSNSASWEESADILPTVTNYLSTNNVRLSSVTITNTLSISSVQISTRPTANVFIGDSTTGNNTNNGSHNFVFGVSAGNGLTTGSNNNFLGGYTGRVNTTGRNNNFFGYRAGSYNTIGKFNNFFGYKAGYFNTAGGYNNFLGTYAGYENITGQFNNFLGPFAGCANTIGSNNTIIGNAANVSTNSLSGVIAIGTGAMATQTNQIVLSTANISLRTLKGTAAGPNLFIGNSTTGRDAATGDHNFVFGIGAGAALTTGSCNNFLGVCAGANNTTGNYNNFFGRQAGGVRTHTGCHNNFFGRYAGACVFASTSNNNNFFGESAGKGFQFAFTGTCHSNFLGQRAGYRIVSSFHNNFFGYEAGASSGFNTTNNCNNNFFGQRAGLATSTGNFNNFIGICAGASNTTGCSNNFFGDCAGKSNTSGGSNVSLGICAGFGTTSGNFNNFFGVCAGLTNTTGSNNTIIGNTANVATNSLSGVIAIGTGAMATESNQIVLSTANVLFRSTGSTFEIGSPSLTDNLTVYGTISSTQAIFASGGNSDQWNSSFTTTQANTATDSFDLSYVGTLPVPLIPILTVNPLRDALIGASGSQAATLRNGKWISGLGITGFNNPTIDNLISLSSTNIVGIRDSFSLSSLTKLSAVSFPSLASIGGSFTCGQNSMNSLTTLSFPSLASVGGNFAGSSGGMNSLTTFSFPSLASVGGNFIVTSGGMNSLTAVSFPSLSSVGGAFQIIIFFPINILTTMSFPSLASVGGAFTVFSNSSMNSLTAVSFPSLVSVNGNFTVSSGGTLERLVTLSFPSLASVGGAFTAINGGNMNSLTTLSFPSLASVGGNFTVTTGSMNSLTTLLIGSGLKHINGDFSSGSLGLDRHNAWSASTYYPSATSFTAPASAFSSTTTGTTCSAAITNHGLQTNDIITVFGITGTTAATHNFNAAVVAVTRIDANNFNYTIAATTQIPIGTATILRQEVAVTPVTKNERKYICTGAGTSGGTEPAWPTTIGATVADGTATWTCSELSLSNILSRLDALSGTNQTTTYGANRSISIGPATLITVNSISTAAGVATITTATNHGITTGTQVVISGCTGTALRYNGVWTVTSTGLTTLTTPVPTDLNGVAGAGTMRLINASPQFTGSMPISATTVTGISADSHMIFSATQLRDVDSGTSLPIFVAGIYNRNGTTNGFARYSCTENGWDIWYDTTSKRWVNSPSQFTGNAATVGNYPNTPQSVPLASTSTGNPASITSTVNHGIATGAVFTVVIEGCSNAALNGSWTATSIGPATFTIPVDGSGGATTSSGTVTVLNQIFNQGILMTGTVASPIQGVQQTITTAGNHGFSTGDFIHFYGAVGTHAASINDLNTTSTTKSVTTSITVDNATTFRCIRYANTQPFVGSYTLTTLPHMRDPSVNDVAYHTSLKLRARGIAVSLRGNTGI